MGLGHGASSGYGVPVFFCVGAIAVAVFKVDPKVLNRLAPELVQDAGIDPFPESEPRCTAIEPLSQSGRSGRVVVEGLQSDFTHLASHVGEEQVGAPIDRMDGLARGRFARIGLEKASVVLAERGEKSGEN
jgi:hypothetical protein